jgi:parallel beta-helix repeat protein
VAWSEAGNIYAAEYSPSANSGQGGWVALGTSLSTGGISNTGAAQDAQIVNTLSGPVVAWLDTSGGVANVFAREFNGTTWVTVGSGSASGHGLTGSSAAVPSFSLATDGTDLALAWTQPGTSAGNSIYVIQNTGSGWAGVKGASTGTGISGPVTAQTPAVAYEGGSLYAAWAANTDGTFNIVAAVATTSGWQAVSIDTPVSAGVNQISRGAASSPVLASNGTSLELVWAEDRLPNTPDQAVAIYANELVGGTFVRELAGDASFDGILGRSTSLSQPAGLAVAVDAAGHPFVAWGDGSSGSPQVYMLGNTLNIHQIIYVSDTSGPQDSYTTQAGSSSFNGLSPSTPLPTIQAALNLAIIAPGDVILVDTGAYPGFTVTSADNGVVIIGAPGGTTDIIGAVSVTGAQNFGLQWMQLTFGATLSGDNNIQLTEDTGGPAFLLDLGLGGSVTVSGGSGVSFDDDAFTGITAGGTANLTIAGSQLMGTGLTLNGAVSGLAMSDSQLESVNVDAASQGIIDGNNISGGGLNLGAGFTGSIAGNFIHGAPTGVTVSGPVSLGGNQIFGNHTGIVVSAGGSLGFLAGSTPNYIHNNGVGVQLNGSMQGQDIYDNDTGVSGSGTLGGSLLADANQIQGNVTGINFSGIIQYNRIDYNRNAVTVQSGQVLAHNLIYDNQGQNLQTLGASDVEIVNNSFYSPSVTNVFVNGGSSDVEILNNILWTGGGYDLDIANDSRTGYFSDYNDLYTTGAGLIVHDLADFSDLLDWQDDVNLYDLHSIGATVVNPALEQPQFVNLAFADFSVLPAVAGIRSSSPTIATGDPESDLALPAVQYNNVLTNPSFESGATGWTVNPGGTTQSSSPSAFDGNSYFFSGAVASGFAQQTISLLSDGYTAAQLDAQDLDISFGGRIRSASETPADQGQIVLTFLDGSGDVIGTPTTLSASNVSDRWELVGGRVHVPQGARSVTYRFQSLRESGSTDDSYLDAAFLYVLPNTVAMDMGAYGGSNDTVGTPVDQKIQLQTPDLYVNWTLTQSHNILWSTFGNTGDSPVRIDLYQQTSGGLSFLLNITPSTADSGSFAWVPQSSGLSYGTYGLRIKVSLVGNSAIQDYSTENFTIPENGNIYYVNDGSRTGDQYTTAAGNNRATGKIPSAPLPLLTTLMRTYAPGATSTVYVDTGTYYDFAPVELSGNPAIGNGAGVTIIGPLPTGGAAATINALGFTTPAVIDVNDAAFVTLENLGMAGAQYGLWVHGASANFTGQDLTATGNSAGGIRLESDSTSAATLNQITVDNNTGDGLYAGGPLVNLTNSVAFNNTGDGFDLANAGAAVLTGDIAYGNLIGLNVINTTGGTTTTVGSTNLALGLGNEFHNNHNDGISANGSVLLAGNIAYGQSAAGDAGIVLAGGATATENVVHDNYDGILSSFSPSSITNNLAYNNSNVGIEGDDGATLSGNVAYSNGVGIRSMSPPNSYLGPYISNNLVYNNSLQGIWLTGGNGATFYNNSVYQPAGDALHLDAYAGLPASGIQIENNILWTQSGDDISLASTSENGFKSDYNDLYFTGSGAAGFWEGTAQATLTSWQSATGNDADSIFANPLFVNAAGGDFHEQSLSGSFHNGSLAPVIGGSGLPVAATATLTADASESPAIDRGDPTFSYANEPSPNGGHINLGAFGNTAQASLSPTSYVLVLKPVAGSTLVAGEHFTIVWRSQDTTGTVNIDLLQGSTTTPIVAGAPNSGSYVWAIPMSISPGSYVIRVTRNAAPTAVGLSPTITINGPVTTFYVNSGTVLPGDITTAPGNDLNSGLDPAHPKASIQSVLASYQLAPGQTIFVDLGNYNETSNIILGPAASGIIIEGSATAGGTVLDRTNTANGSYVFDLQGATNVTFESLSITGGQYGINASNGAGSTGLTVSNSSFYGSEQAGINLGAGNNGAAITGSSFHDMLGAIIPTGVETSGDQVSITNDKAYNLPSYGIYVVNANGSTISGNVVYNDGIGIYTDVSTVSGNIAYNNPDAGILITGNSTVTGNTTYNNISTKSVNGFPQAGIELGGGTASGNVSYGNVYGIYFTGNTATASDNLVYNNSTAGILGGNGSTILGNVLYGNGLGISLSSYPAAAETGPVLENNLVYNNVNGGIYLVGGDTTPILNNTIYQTSGDGLQIVVYSGEPTNNVQVRDNIFWNSAGPDISIDSGSEPGVHLDYNDLYAVSTGMVGSWGGSGYATLAAWQGATQMDAYSISADPLFVNAAAGDFHEQSSNGSYHGGTLAPILNMTTGLPQANPGALTDDANESPAIDRGNPADSYANEPLPNGGYVNLGAYGNSIQASLSPQHYLFITNPVAGQTAAAGQGLSVLWRDEVANTGAGASDTDTLQLLGANNNVVLTTSAPDVGSYLWALPGSLASGVYQVRVIRNDGTGLSATSGAISVSAFDGIYYVNGSSTGGVFTTAGGNDANSGLDPAHPKATIAAIFAAYTLQPGNVIMVDSATYNLTANMVLTAADDGITIEGAGGGKTVLNRGSTASGSYAFDIQGAINLTLEGLTITGAYIGVNASFGDVSTGLTVTNCIFMGDQYIGVDLQGSNGSATVSDNNFDGSLDGTFGGSTGLYSQSNSVVVDLNIAYGMSYGIEINGGTTAAGDTIDNNTAYKNNTGISVISSNTGTWAVNGNTVYDNFQTNLTLSGNLAASGNIVYQDGGAGSNEVSFEQGVNIANGPVVTNSVIYGNVIGIEMANGATASGNRVYDNSGAGIVLTSQDTVTGNDVYSNGQWGIQYGYGGGTATTISNNLVYANVTGGIELSNAYQLQVVDNTVYQTAGPAVQADGTGGYSEGVFAPTVNLQNNILWATAGPDVSVADGVEEGFTSDYNDLYFTGTGQVAQMAGVNFTTLSSWSWELGLDTHSISADPQFVNPAGPDGLLGYISGADHGADDDFHVQPTSPTIDAGNPASEFVSEPQPNGGRVNLGYDGDTSQAATSSSATTVQVISPSNLGKVQAGQPTTIQWLSTGLLATQTLTEVATGESVAVGEYHPAEFSAAATATGFTNSAINTSLVTNPAPQAVYQNYAYAASGVGNYLLYSIPVPNGTYTIRLDWAEPIYSSVGARTFDILLQGQVVHSAFDVYAAAGDASDKAVALAFTVTASGGSGITLELKNDTSNPAFLNGFEISQANAGGTPSPTANIQLSADGGSTWSTIATNQPIDSEGRGSFVWTPTTQTAGYTALVRVVANNAAATTGVSGPFLIANSGTSFYVNDSSTVGDVYTTAVGNNANSGKSPGAPMASIEAVLNDYPLVAGDTIYVDNGTYTLFHNIDIPVADSGVIIQGPSVSGTSAVLNRNSTGSNDYVFYLLPAVQNITLADLSITGAYFGINSPLIEGTTTLTSGITVENDQIYSNANHGIDTGFTNNWTITGNVIHDNGFDGINLQSGTGTITNNTIYNESGDGIFFSTPVSGVPANLVSGNTVYGNGSGIYVDGVTVTGNFVHDNTSMGIYADTYSVVTGNTVWRQTATNAVGIEASNATVADNAVFGNYNGVLVNGGEGIHAYGNRIYSNTNYGLLLENVNGSAFSIGYNYVATAYSNLIYANSTGGVFITGPFDVSLVNNTIYQLVGSAVVLSGSISATYPLTIENNILWVQAGDDLDLTSTSTQAGLVSDYNLLYRTGANAYVGVWNGTSQSTLAAWRTASGLDAHSSEANPLFVDPAGADAVLGYNPTAQNGNGYDGGGDDNFFVAAGSPAIAAGNHAVAPPADLLGYSLNPVPDLGAYAYRGTSADSAPPTVVSATPGVGQITVVFSQTPNDVDAAAASLYVLVGAGPDGIFGTSDDVNYALTPSYQPGTNRVVLNIIGGPLPDGLYQLTILSNANSSVHNLAGVALDGDGNGTPGGNYVRTFSVAIPALDVVTGTSGVDTITLTQDVDHQHVDWTLDGGTVYQLPINDPNGLTINGNGGNDVIDLVYTNGDPLPSTLHLNGTFTVNNLQGTNPLAGTMLDIGQSTVFIAYNGFDPISAIEGDVRAGYDNGAWNGTPTASTGVITSSAAATSHLLGLNATGIGYADSSDGAGIDATPNTVELKYTLYGDANLSTTVNSADLQVLLANLNHSGMWDQGDFNYDDAVNSADLQALLATLNKGLGLSQLDTISGTSGVDTVVLILDPDHVHVDWSMGAAAGQLLVNDPNGLTINGNGGNDVIDLLYSNGSPLPNTLHLNGTFTINNLTGTNPLAGTTLDIGRSTVFISYSASDPITAIKNYLKAGYNSGAWNGTASASTGVITSASAAANSAGNLKTTAIGYSDWADGQGVNTNPNTIELTYTLYGDANLDHQVNSADLQILLASLNRTGAWDQGDFNYDGQVNSADFQTLLFTLNTSLGNQAAGTTSAAAASASAGAVPERSKSVASTPASSPSAAVPKLAIVAGQRAHRAARHRRR